MKIGFVKWSDITVTQGQEFESFFGAGPLLTRTYWEATFDGPRYTMVRSREENARNLLSDPRENIYMSARGETHSEALEALLEALAAEGQEVVDG